MLPADLPVRITIDVDGSGGADMIKRHPLVIFTLLTFGLGSLVILGPAAFSAVVAGAYVLVGGSWQDAAPAAFQLSIPALALFFAVLILTDGLGEELGWRGFALPGCCSAGRR